MMTTTASIAESVTVSIGQEDCSASPCDSPLITYVESHTADSVVLSSTDQKPEHQSTEEDTSSTRRKSVTFLLLIWFPCNQHIITTFKTLYYAYIHITPQNTIQTLHCNKSPPLRSTGTDSNCASPNDTETKTLSSKGYQRDHFICNTLQGQVFMARRMNPQNGTVQNVVIKTANIALHQQGITMLKGHKRKVQENIFGEYLTLKKFTECNAPSSCIKFHDFFMDREQFYLVMERGGQSLFEFVVEAHRWIKSGHLSIDDWQKHVCCMFVEMVEFIRWMHEKQFCCNLDISLENIVLSENVRIRRDEQSGLIVIDNLHIKFIDFGLIQQFKQNETEFVSQKFVGKAGYKAPQIYYAQKFHANKADIWSLGVCLFMMLVGAPPFVSADWNDVGFRLICNGDMKRLLLSWKRCQYVTADLYDLIQAILRNDESKRIDLEAILNHTALRMFLVKDCNEEIGGDECAEM